MDFEFWCTVGWKVNFDVVYVDREFWYVHSVYVQANIFDALVIWLIRICTVVALVYICTLFIYLFCFLYFPFFFSTYFPFSRFCVYIFCKPSRDLTRPLGGTKRFKGIVAYATYNCNSCESELGSSISFSFILLEDEEKIGVGVFVRW